MEEKEKRPRTDGGDVGRNREGRHKLHEWAGDCGGGDYHWGRRVRELGTPLKGTPRCTGCDRQPPLAAGRI